MPPQLWDLANRASPNLKLLPMGLISYVYDIAAKYYHSQDTTVGAKTTLFLFFVNIQVN